MNLVEYLQEQLDVEIELDDGLIEPAFIYDTFQIFGEEDEQ